MPSSQTEWDPDRIRQWFASRETRPAMPPPVSRYHQAAAVLGSFDHRTLHDAAGTPPGSAELSRLLADCAPVPGEGVQWSLKAEVRRQTLATFPDAASLRSAFTWNPRPTTDPLQVALDAYVLGPALDLTSQTDDQLAWSAQVVSWLSGTPAAAELALPDPDTIRRRLDFVRLLAPLRQMAGDHFRGRKKELGNLRDFLLAPMVDLAPKPFVLHGFGGCGKTTLIARFLLDYAAGRVPGAPSGPFVFLDFDRPGLVPEEPATLLLEAARQLAVQSSGSQSAAEPLARGLESLLRNRTDKLPDGDRSLGGLLVGSSAALLLNQFADQFRSGEWAGRPVLLVLDTFEEVQYHSQKVVEHVWEFLGQLRDRVPMVRVVVAGRAPVLIGGTDAPASATIALDELDRDAAVACLGFYGIPRATALFIYDRIGGNPLALRLAGELARSGPELGLQEFFSTEFSTRLDNALTQAILFRRFLGHIKSKDVQKLAHPGLTLRRITPELIKEVLAGPCEVNVPDLRRADELCAELARETALVEQDSGGLRHRPELRRQMIRLLRNSRPQQVDEIHRAAVAFYRPRTDTASQAELLYHLLWLNAPREELDAVWHPALASLLLLSRDELPEEALRYLASQSTSGGFEAISTSTDEWREQELVTWERKTVQWARELIRLDRYEEVDRELRRRPEWQTSRPVSPLFLIHARVLRALGDATAAARLLSDALRQWPANASPADRIDLLLFYAQLQADLDRPEFAAGVLRDAELLIAEAGTREQGLEEAVTAARLESGDGAAHERLGRVLGEWKESELRGVRRLARQAAAELLGRDRREAARAIRAAGLGPLGPDDQDSLADALDEWDRTSNVGGGLKPALFNYGIAFHAGLEKYGSAGRLFWTRWVSTTSADQMDDRIARMLEEFEPIPPVVAALRSVLRGRSNVAGRRAGQAKVIESQLSDKDFFERLVRLIVDSYDAASLTRFVRSKLDVRLDDIVPRDIGSFRQKAFALVEYCQRHGRLQELISALAASRLQHPGWADFVETVGTLLPSYREPSPATRNFTLPLESALLPSNQGASPSPRNLAMSPVLQVKGHQYQQLVEALADAFPNNGRLSQMLQFRLSKMLAHLADPANPLPQVIFDVVGLANAQGWTAELIAAARESAPGNPKLLKLVQDFGLTATTAELERKIRDDLNFADIAQWRRRLGEIEVQVCRVETPGEMGTGFLVGPDMVLTNYHVMKQVIENPTQAPQVVMRFDYKALLTGDPVNKGTEVRLAANWLVDYSPYSPIDLLADPGSATPTLDQLDYALVRLADEVGEAPVAATTADPSTPKRGWLTPTTDFAFPAGAALFIVQHPEAKPLKLAYDTKSVLGLNGNGTRVRYVTNTEPGSSGSPVFDQNWNWVALHHSGDRSIVPVYNQGIPLRPIMDLLAKRGKKLPPS